MSNLISVEPISRKILTLQGQRVMLDADLAQLYGTTTKALNPAVKRNKQRFPEDFMFQLTALEKAEVVTICDHLHKLKFSRTLPRVFTEQGTMMLANVLKSAQAIQSSILIVRAFIQLRTFLYSHKELTRKLENLEKKYDTQFKAVFDAILKLMEPPPFKPSKKNGF